MARGRTLSPIYEVTLDDVLEYALEIKDDSAYEPLPEVASVMAGIASLRTAPMVAFTQALYKEANPRSNALALKPKGDSPRSVWKKKLAAPLQTQFPSAGFSNDVYVSEVYRRPPPCLNERWVAAGKGGSGRAARESLFRLLEGVQGGSLAPFAVSTQLLVELVRAAEKVDAQLSALRPRIVCNQMSLWKAIDEFLQTAGGGSRAEAIAAGLYIMRQEEGEFSKLTLSEVNAADAATGSAGDIQATYSDDGTVEVAEVKHKPLSRSEFQVSVEKARRARVSSLIFLIHSLEQFTSGDERFITAEAGRNGRENDLHIGFARLTDVAFSTLRGQSRQLRFIDAVASRLHPVERQEWADTIARWCSAENG